MPDLRPSNYSASQVGNLETLIGSRALYSDHVLLLFSVELLMVNCTREIMVWVLPGRSVPPHVDSDKPAEMNCIPKNKCPDSQKLNTRRRSENLNALSVTRVKATTCISLHCLSLIYSMWGKKSVRKSYFHSETVLFCWMFCVIIRARPIGDSITPRLDKVQ